MGKEFLTIRQFCAYVSSISSIGVLPNVSQRRIEEYKACFKQKQYEAIVSKVLGDLKMKTKIGVSFMEDSLILRDAKELSISEEMFGILYESRIFFDRIREPAHVLIDRNMPMFGTSSFENFKTSMRVGESMKYEKFETFVSCVAHELVHVLLHALRHPLCHSEIATDLAVLSLGFRDIAKEGRVTRKGSGLGYLSNKQFMFAYKMLRPEWRVPRKLLAAIGK